MSAVERWVPGVRMLRTYRRAWLRPDVVAGVVLAAILVPQGMAYAELAGLPPVTGLYTTIACLVGYAAFGPSRILVLGPDSSVSPLIFAAITPLLVAGDPTTAVALAGMMALLVGAIEIGLGLAKLGFVADLLSKEVQVGYMNGLAVTIIAGQLPKLFGFSTDADGFVAEMKAFVSGLDQTNTTALAVGLATLVLLLALPRMTTKIPAVLVAVVAAIVVTAVFDLAADGVKTVGALPSGLPAPTFPSVPLGDIGPLLVAALGIVLVSLTDTIATSTSFAARRGDEVDPNQEMIGMGAANVAAGFFQGFAISASGSRTAVAEQSGSKSQVTGLVGAVVVAVLLVFLPWLLQNLPQPALAAIVIAAALSLVNVKILRTYARVRRTALVLVVGRDAGGHPLRRAAGHPDRDHAVDPAVLPAKLVAVRRDPRTRRALGGVAQQAAVPGVRRGARRRRLPVGGAAVLRERRHLPPGDPPPGAHAKATLDRAAVRGRHRRRRDGRRRARAARPGAQRRRASTWRSWSCATGSRTSCTATGCSRRSIAGTCSTRSTRRSPASRPKGATQPWKREGLPRMTRQSSPSDSRQVIERAPGE